MGKNTMILVPVLLTWGCKT